MKKITALSFSLMACCAVAASNNAAPAVNAMQPAVMQNQSNAIMNMPVTNLAGNMQVKQAYVETWQPTGNSAGAFMELVNHSNRAITVIAAFTPLAQETELHDFADINGQQVMQQVAKIVVKANSEDDLKPGGFHVMLMGLNKPLQNGMSVPITLIFSDGSDLQVNAIVGKQIS